MKWSCDERDRKACRNGHGCHCREITALCKRVKDLEGLCVRAGDELALARDQWMKSVKDGIFKSRASVLISSIDRALGTDGQSAEKEY